MRTIESFIEAVAHTGAFVNTPNREEVVSAVLGELRVLVSEESEDIGAVLPADLRELWLAAAPRS